jgi:hypothetical protein
VVYRMDARLGEGWAAEPCCGNLLRVMRLGRIDTRTCGTIDLPEVFVHKSRYLKFDAMQVWWPQSVEAVAPLLGRAPVVMLWQCPTALTGAFRPWTFQLPVRSPQGPEDGVCDFG